MYRKSPFFRHLKNFVIETLDENFSSENFSHPEIFLHGRTKNEVLTKIFHNENFKNEI